MLGVNIGLDVRVKNFKHNEEINLVSEVENFHISLNVNVDRVFYDLYFLFVFNRVDVVLEVSIFKRLIKNIGVFKKLIDIGIENLVFLILVLNIALYLKIKVNLEVIISD